MKGADLTPERDRERARVRAGMVERSGRGRHPPAHFQVVSVNPREGVHKMFNLSKRLLAAAIPIALAATVAGVAPASAQEEKPNILFIMGDDIGWMQPASTTAA